MLEQSESAIHLIVRAIEWLGVGVIAVGAIAMLALFLVRIATGGDRLEAYRGLRQGLGRAILLGLEFLVAADIINTITIEPTLQSVAVLAAIVAIRTLLSFSLEVELEGRWPWQLSQSAP
jgi:uncharacterized membrane protein